VRLRHLDLFAGIGGFSLGLERAGLTRPAGFVEIDPFCQRVIARHWPDAPIHSDVTTREFIEGEADVITAGFPCQDVSLAGKRAGLSGARSGLYRHVVRAVRMVRPRVALLENVAALLCGGMGAVLGDLAEVGYDAEWHCIPACAIGAPHRRDRVWIIANPGGEQHQGDRAPLSGAIAAELSRAAADAAGSDDWLSAAGTRERQESEFGGRALAPDVADAMCDDEQGIFAGGADAKGRQGPLERSSGPCGDGAGWWAVEPDVGRVGHGIPARVDRLRSLGNAVVPQVVEVIGRALRLREMEARQ
jgi:DNA (cytosine-5)-methyltransferase 1